MSFQILVKLLTMAVAATSSGSSRLRWCLDVEKVGEQSSLVIKTKDARNNVVNFSKARRGLKVKQPWGPPESCTIGTETTQDGMEYYFLFQRGGTDSAKFYLTSLHSFAAGTSTFAKEVQSLVTRSKLELLAQLLSLLPESEGFTNHHQGIHSKLGLRLDKQGVTEEALVKTGGSLEYLEKFVETANKSAKQVLGTQSITMKNFVTVSKVTKAKKIKLSVEEAFNEELKDKGGIEREFVNSFMGNIDVEISALEIDPALSVMVSPLHVEGIKREMLKRFDPSLLCIAVRPVDPENYDREHPEKSKFLVIQGVKSFCALKILQREKKTRIKMFQIKQIFYF